MKPEKLFERTSAQLTTYLRAHRKRQTYEREFILRECCYAKQPFDKADIRDKALANGISRASVYNALSTLLDAHIIRPTSVGSWPQNMYEIVAPRQTRFIRICTCCHKEWEFRDPVVEKHLKSREYLNFSMNCSMVYVYGTCQVCHGLGLKSKKKGRITDAERIDNEQ